MARNNYVCLAYTNLNTYVCHMGAQKQAVMIKCGQGWLKPQTGCRLHYDLSKIVRTSVAAVIVSQTRIFLLVNELARNDKEKKY